MRFVGAFSLPVLFFALLGCVSGAVSGAEWSERNPASSQILELIEATRKFVVEIAIEDDQSKIRKNTGSGVWVGDKLILTNYHVAEKLLATGAQGYAIDAMNDRIQILGIVAKDDKCDLAVIRTQSEAKQPANAEAAMPLLGSHVLVWGVPEGDSVSVLKANIVGIWSVSQISPPKAPLERGDCQLIQISTTIFSGMSGGPVFNADKMIVGLVNASFDRVFGSGYAVSGREIVRFLKML